MRRTRQKGKLKGRLEGKQEGKKEGEETGLKHQSLNLVRYKFGGISPELENKISGLSRDDMDMTFRRLYDASGLEELSEFSEPRADIASGAKPLKGRWRQFAPELGLETILPAARAISLPPS